MPETIIRSFELDPKDETITPPSAKLAYEGLMRVVSVGGITHEHVHETMKLVVESEQDN